MIFCVEICFFLLVHQAGAWSSVITGTSDGVLTQRCLEVAHKPQIRRANVPVVFEENDWTSHHLSSCIAGIILREHVGYPVRFNAVPTSSRISERIATAGDKGLFKAETDGSQLANVLRGPFYYANVEAWGLQHAKKQQTYALMRRNLVFISKADHNYYGREGWYMPSWLAQDCGGLDFQSWSGSPQSDIFKAMNTSGEVVNCPGMGSFGPMWCPRAGAMMKLRTMPYSERLQRQLILNLGLSIAIETYSLEDFWSILNSSLSRPGAAPFQACGKLQAKLAFLTYLWEPVSMIGGPGSTLERLPLPSVACGSLASDSWRCDFLSQALAIAASHNALLQTPLLEQFLDNFRVDDMSSILREVSTETPTTEMIWSASCNWVRANRHIWTTWVRDRRDMPWWADMLEPWIFFAMFFCVFASMLAMSYLNEATISQDGSRKEEVFGWPVWMEINPLCSYLRKFIKKICRYAEGVAAQVNVSTVQEARRKVFSYDTSVGGSFVMWASHCFFGNFRDGKVSICLLRFGAVESQTCVYVSTEAGTMKETFLHMPTFEPLENQQVLFEPGCSCVWIDVQLNPIIVWWPALKFQVHLQGDPNQLRSRTATCVVYTTEPWPLRSNSLNEWPHASSLLRTARMIAILFKFFAIQHTYKDEVKRVLYTMFEAVYDTAVSNYLLNVYVLRTCLTGEGYTDLLLVIPVHGIAMCMKRQAHWRFWENGTYGIGMRLRNAATIMYLEQPYPEESMISKSRFMSMHMRVINDALPQFYFKGYMAFKSLVSLVAGLVYILAFNQQTQTGAVNTRLYEGTVYIILVATCLYAGCFRSWSYLRQVLIEIQRTFETYSQTLSEKVKLVDLIHAYGPSAVTNAVSQIHSKGTFPWFCALSRRGLYELDCSDLMEELASSCYTAAVIVFGLLTLESRLYGTVFFDTSSFITMLTLYSHISKSIQDLCDAIRTLTVGLKDMENMHAYFNEPAAKHDNLAREQKLAFQELNLYSAPSADSLYASFEQALKIVLSDGVDAKLGSAYIVQSNVIQEPLSMEKKRQSALFEPQASESDMKKYILSAMPIFCRTVHLRRGIDPHWIDENVVNHLLAFAEPGRFCEEDVMSVLGCLDVDCELLMSYTPSRVRSGTQIVPDISLETHKTSTNDRLMLAQAFLSDPDVLILDDFFSIDMSHRVEMLRAALKWQRGGTSALIDGDNPSSSACHPPWRCREGGIVRTLVLNLNDVMLQDFKEELQGVSQLVVGSGPMPDSNNTVSVQWEEKATISDNSGEDAQIIAAPAVSPQAKPSREGIGRTLPEVDTDVLSGLPMITRDRLVRRALRCVTDPREGKIRNLAYFIFVEKRRTERTDVNVNAGAWASETVQLWSTMRVAGEQQPYLVAADRLMPHWVGRPPSISDSSSEDIPTS